MGLNTVTKNNLLKMGSPNPTEKKELSEILDLGGGEKTSWYYEDGYKWPQNSQNTIKGPRQSILDIQNKVKLTPSSVGTGQKLSVTYKIGRQKVKFMETGGGKSGVSDSKMTEIQELGSAKVFEYAIKKNKSEYKSLEHLMSDKKLMDELTGIWTKESSGKLKVVDQEWLESFYKQQKALIDKISTPRFTEFNRNGGFMDYISDKLKELGISKKDNSNPSDIWLIQDEDAAIEKINKVLERGTGRKTTSRLAELNAIMRVLFREKKVFGISLKKIGSGPAKIEFANDSKKFFSDMASLEFKFLYAKCSLGTKNDKNGEVTLSSQDTRFVVEQGGQNTKTHDFQIKANDSKDFSGLKFEPTTKGSGAARLGKATVELVVQAMEDHRLTFDKSKNAYPKTLDDFVSKKIDYKNMISDLKNVGVDIEVKDADTAIDNMITVMCCNPHVVNTKCMQITWLHQVMVKMQRSELNDFCADMVFLAMKVGRSNRDRYGPFAKIY